MIWEFQSCFKADIGLFCEISKTENVLTLRFRLRQYMRLISVLEVTNQAWVQSGQELHCPVIRSDFMESDFILPGKIVWVSVQSDLRARLTANLLKKDYISRLCSCNVRWLGRGG